jgi:hypothetical protein
MDLEVQKVILAEEQAHDLHPFDGRDLSAEVEEIHARMDGIKGECATEGCYPSRIFPNSQSQLRRSWRWLVFF